LFIHCAAFQQSRPLFLADNHNWTKNVGKVKSALFAYMASLIPSSSFFQRMGRDKDAANYQVVKKEKKKKHSCGGGGGKSREEHTHAYNQCTQPEPEAMHK
jgi:hypothetical protein